jgi:sugar lactone lactonase YvrE
VNDDRLEPLLDGLVFPESPRWHDGRLWFVDMFARQVKTVDMDGRSHLVAELPDDPSGLGFLPDGTPLVVLMNRREIVSLGPGGIQLHADLSHIPVSFINDMVVTDDGRAYVGGVVWKEKADIGTDKIILVESDGQVRIAADDESLNLPMQPNGMVITPDGKTMIFSSSRYGRQHGDFVVRSLSIDDDGLLHDPQLFADVPGVEPDGLCLDSEGSVWVGGLVSNAFVRVSQGGHVEDSIAVADRLAVACVLGGPDRRTLFLLSVAGRRSHLRTEAVGYIHKATVDVPGAGWP